MTSCIADTDEADGLYLAADTLITWSDTATGVLHDDVTRMGTYEYPFPKLVLLRPDLCAAIAGDDPERSVQILCSMRNDGLPNIVRACSQMVGADFILASLSPHPEIVTIRGGSRRSDNDPVRGWIGDFTAFENCADPIAAFRQAAPNRRPLSNCFIGLSTFSARRPLAASYCQPLRKIRPLYFKDNQNESVPS